MPSSLQQAVLDHGDAVGVVRGVEAVRDRDDRSPLEHEAERALEVPGRARVEERRRLVEDERVRVGEHEPGQRELLRLRGRERVAAGADRRLEPVRKRLGPVERVDGGERRRRAPRPPADGRASRRFSASVPTKTCCSCVTSATSCRSVSSGRSTSRTPPTSTRPARGGWIPASRRPSVDLPAPGRPDHCDALAGLEVEVDAVEDVAVVDVRVADVVRAQAVVLGPLAGRGAVGRDLRDPDETRERGRADLDLVEPGDQAVDGIGERRDVERDRPSPRRSRRVPRETSQPPQASAAATGSAYANSAVGNQIVRR